MRYSQLNFQTNNQSHETAPQARKYLRVVAVIAGLALTVAVAGCSGSSHASSRTSSTDPSPSSTYPPASFGTLGADASPIATDSTAGPTTGSTDPSLTLGGTFDLQNTGGDHITAAVSTSAPIPLSQAPASATQCAQSIYADPARSLAIHMHVDVTQHATIAGQVELAIYLTGPDDSTRGGAITPSTAGGAITTCTAPNTPNYDRFNFDSLAPGQTNTYDDWWILPGAITPNAPTGNSNQLAQFVLNPLMADEMTGGNWTTGTAIGPALQRCPNIRYVGLAAPDHGIRFTGNLPTGCSAIASYPLTP